jgi:hypothetical protein
LFLGPSVCAVVPVYPTGGTRATRAPFRDGVSAGAFRQARTETRRCMWDGCALVVMMGIAPEQVRRNSTCSAVYANDVDSASGSRCDGGGEVFDGSNVCLQLCNCMSFHSSPLCRGSVVTYVSLSEPSFVMNPLDQADGTRSTDQEICHLWRPSPGPRQEPGEPRYRRRFLEAISSRHCCCLPRGLAHPPTSPPPSMAMMVVAEIPQRAIRSLPAPLVRIPSPYLH